MSKTKKIILMGIILLSIVIVIIVSILVLDTTGVINQGKYRFNDVIVKSSANISEQVINAESSISMETMLFNLSQTNKISMLITKEIEAEKIYIDNIAINSKTPSSNFVIYQTNYDTKHSYFGGNQEINIYLEEKNEQYFIELNFDNIDFKTNTKLPTDQNTIKFDGTLFKLLGLETKDITFNLKFNLNVIDKSGRKSVAKIELELPREELINHGVSIVRESLSNFVFTVEN